MRAAHAWQWTGVDTTGVTYLPMSGFTGYRGWASDYSSLYSGYISPCNPTAYMYFLKHRPGSEGVGFYYDPLSDGSGWCRSITSGNALAVRTDYNDGAWTGRGSSGVTYLPTCVPPTSENQCTAAASAAGLKLGGGGFDFAGDYGSGRGCYTYTSGSYKDLAFWSTSGNPSGSVGNSRSRVCMPTTKTSPYTWASLNPCLDSNFPHPHEIFDVCVKVGASVKTGNPCGDWCSIPGVARPGSGCDNPPICGELAGWDPQCTDPNFPVKYTAIDVCAKPGGSRVGNPCGDWCNIPGGTKPGSGCPNPPTCGEQAYFLEAGHYISYKGWPTDYSNLMSDKESPCVPTNYRANLQPGEGFYYDPYGGQGWCRTVYSGKVSLVQAALSGGQWTGAGTAGATYLPIGLNGGLDDGLSGFDGLIGGVNSLGFVANQALDCVTSQMNLFEPSNFLGMGRRLDEDCEIIPSHGLTLGPVDTGQLDIPCCPCTAALAPCSTPCFGFRLQLGAYTEIGVTWGIELHFSTILKYKVRFTRSRSHEISDGKEVVIYQSGAAAVVIQMGYEFTIDGEANLNVELHVPVDVHIGRGESSCTENSFEVGEPKLLVTTDAKVTLRFEAGLVLEAKALGTVSGSLSAGFSGSASLTANADNSGQSGADGDARLQFDVEGGVAVEFPNFALPSVNFCDNTIDPDVTFNGPSASASETFYSKSWSAEAGVAPLTFTPHTTSGGGGGGCNKWINTVPVGGFVNKIVNVVGTSIDSVVNLGISTVNNLASIVTDLSSTVTDLVELPDLNPKTIVGSIIPDNFDLGDIDIPDPSDFAFPEIADFDLSDYTFEMPSFNFF